MKPYRRIALMLAIGIADVVLIFVHTIAAVCCSVFRVLLGPAMVEIITVDGTRETSCGAEVGWVRIGGVSRRPHTVERAEASLPGATPRWSALSHLTGARVSCTRLRRCICV